MMSTDLPRSRTIPAPPSRSGAAAASVALAAAVLLALAATCAVTSTRWIGTTFPGFFVMPNRVVPSVGLSHWTGVEAGGIYQRAVVAVNGEAVATAGELYERVRAHPPGSPIEYTFAGGDAPFHRTIASMTFRLRDYVELFVPFLLNGLIFAAAGLTVWFLKPHAPASGAMLVFGLCLGVFCLTGTDLYAPQWFYRFYLAAEAFLPASVLHLALVFPENHVGGRRRLLLVVPYGAALVLALAHQWFHFEPATFSFIRNLCSDYLGAAGVGLIVAVAYDCYTTTSHLVRQRVRVLLIGTIAGLGVPTVLMVASGLSGGSVPVNTAAFTAFVFPLTLAYAIVKHDLFAIDAMVKRALYYLAMTGTVFVAYALVLAVLNVGLHSTGLLDSPIYPLLLSLAVVVFFDPAKVRVRRIVDRLSFRGAYDPEKVLQAASQALASTSQLATVLEVVLGTICREMQVTHAHVYLSDGKGALTLARSAGTPVAQTTTAIPRTDRSVGALSESARALSVYDVAADGPGDAASQTDVFAALHADLLVPLRFGNELVGIVALGAKASGKFYTAADLDFLTTLSAQSVVSILHAVAYQQIDDLNRELERKVARRTEELARANTELTASLGERERAYVKLQRSQEQLLHAEKMATLGRLTAGIAHEISTPLGAALSSLRVLGDLAREYRAAIEAPGATPDDHREIATELAEVSAEANEWTEKAARFVRSIKMHTLGRTDLHEREFNLAEVVTETGQLLTHRLLVCGCTLRIEVAADTPPLFGDPGRLGQVVTNLVTNAIDAYSDRAGGGDIRIGARPESDAIVLRVSDDGAGIRPEHQPRIFDELFTTKPPGLGTGLGLSISRTILQDCFGATIEAESDLGRGSTFTVRLPIRQPEAHDAPEVAAAACS